MVDIYITRPSQGGARAYRDAKDLVDVTTITVTHNLGYPPVVYFIPSDGGYSEQVEVIHASDLMSFTAEFAVAVTGKLYLL